MWIEKFSREMIDRERKKHQNNKEALLTKLSRVKIKHHKFNDSLV